ncbi:MAG: ATP-binding protein, partial [Baekduiaceae bacterium]
LRLVVTDDGGGLPPGRERSALAEGHIGLAAARDRVRRRGGPLAIEPGPADRGTRVTIVLPPRAAGPDG